MGCEIGIHEMMQPDEGACCANQRRIKVKAWTTTKAMCVGPQPMPHFNHGHGNDVAIAELRAARMWR
jgi:hypothetical protein